MKALLKPAVWIVSAAFILVNEVIAAWIHSSPTAPRLRNLAGEHT
ncbi:MAG: hypothetical protein Q7J84_03540 [Sulfuricaulis sp.]|nr:hypothetical protein [Sulfuricaulis sp.]